MLPVRCTIWMVYDYARMVHFSSWMQFSSCLLPLGLLDGFCKLYPWLWISPLQPMYQWFLTVISLNTLCLYKTILRLQYSTRFPWTFWWMDDFLFSNFLFLLLSWIICSFWQIEGYSFVLMIYFLIVHTFEWKISVKRYQWIYSSWLTTILFKDWISLISFCF